MPGRKLDDNAQILLRYANGARGALWASQVAPGNENGLRLRVYGTKGGLALGAGEPQRAASGRRSASRRASSPAAARARAPRRRASPACRRGHPEGYLEGFANIYSEVALAIKAAREGKKPPAECDFPTIDDGVKGVAFVEAAVKSSKANGAWVKLEG